MTKTFISLILFFFVLLSCANNSTDQIQNSDQNDTQIDASDSITKNSSKNNSQVDLVTEQNEINCNNEKRAYEFGREMHSWVKLRDAGLSLNDAIEEFSESLGLAAPYNADNDCVKKGFQDASNGKESPYNKEGRSWTTF